jgi:hypothetical protein
MLKQGERYEGADRHEGDRWAKIKAAARDPSNSIRRSFRNLLRVVIPVPASSTVHTVLLFLLRSNTQRLPTANAQIATRDSNQRAFLPLFLAFAHRARIPSEILFFAAADRRRLRLGDFAPAGTAGRRIE